ncbi:hypothetical protein GCM10011586_23680 [Silvibacterium dinghuense]|nr:hypothetical protein GCM10011586_23680 [Silvibacterium dinghuense]
MPDVPQMAGRTAALAPVNQQVQYPRGTLIGDKQEQAMMAGRHAPLESVYSSITHSNFGQNHPILGKILGGIAQVPATIADIGASLPFHGAAASLIPGTSINFGLQKQGLENRIGNEEKQQLNEAQTEEQKAQTAEANARTAEIPEARKAAQQEMEAQLAEHGLGFDANNKIVPLPEDQLAPELRTKLAGQWKPVTGMLGMNNEPLEYNEQTGMYRPAPGIGQVQALKQPGESAAQDDQRYESLVAKSIEGQQLSSDERAFVKAYRDRKTLGQQVTNFYANQRDQGKQDVSTRQAAFKAYQPAMDSAERFNVMAKNYEDAVKNHNQQAMLSLLANHLGMTMGLQKGARLSRDIIQEAQQSMPYLQGLQAKFDKDGYLQGVTLSPEQMRQMVDLGRERYVEDVTKARNEAQYLGATDDGPARTPNKSVINQYIGMAGGDVNKAK